MHSNRPTARRAVTAGKGLTSSGMEESAAVAIVSTQSTQSGSAVAQ
jgi:hypothetical protein